MRIPPSSRSALYAWAGATCVRAEPAPPRRNVAGSATREGRVETAVSIPPSPATKDGAARAIARTSVLRSVTLARRDGTCVWRAAQVQVLSREKRDDRRCRLGSEEPRLRSVGQTRARSQRSPSPAAAKTGAAEDLQREIIDFDSEAPEGREFLAFSTATGLSRFTDIAWPKGLEPKTGRGTDAVVDGVRLPRADVLVVTWTVDEGHALSRVLTPGKDSRNDYRPTRRTTRRSRRRCARGCPALEAKRLGAYLDDEHRQEDSRRLQVRLTHVPGRPQLPNDRCVGADHRRRAADARSHDRNRRRHRQGGRGRRRHREPARAIRLHIEVQGQPLRESITTASVAPRRHHFAQAKKLFKANADQLPKDNTRPPKIVKAARDGPSVIGRDNRLLRLRHVRRPLSPARTGSVSEMGDAVLGLVANQMGDRPAVARRPERLGPPDQGGWLTLKQQAALAAQIYKGFGRWSSVCSAIVCWALIAAE